MMLPKMLLKYLKWSKEFEIFANTLFLNKIIFGILL